ncbi:hypothetical protein [Pseudarthrobacter albicanus]|jgi:hypothetical protein|uniref:hypothetical protein n=1 Tax=Pseudarthrobacter TaxID=1742993 RepID=UPI001BA6FE16|nr:hypothetical protein [Pseudarthrobacter albicanus]
MIVFLVGFATVVALVSCEVLRVLKPEKRLPKGAVLVTAALLSVIGISVVVQLVTLA